VMRRTFLASGAATAASAALPAAGLAQGVGDNPVSAPWTGPYGGVPAFDKVRTEQFKPAIEAAIEERRSEIRALTVVRSAPTFENTLAALENGGRTLDRATTIYGVIGGNLSTPEFRAVEKEIDPQLSALSDEITQNSALFSRIEAVYKDRDKAGLTPEQKRLSWYYWNTFVRAGAKLDPAAKTRVAAINKRLSSLYNSFNENLLADEETFIPLAEADLAGLPDAVKDAVRESARERKLQAAGAIVNTRSSVDPYLAYATNRTMREKVWRAFVNRGDNGDENDNNAAIKEILKLRAERAKLLGYPTHAHWRLEDAMAKTPENALALLQNVWPAAVQRVREEVADMQAIADAEGAKITIEPWDYRFYAEKVRAAKYDLDMNAVKPYMQLEKMREAMFWTAGELYGLTFDQVQGVPVFHPDVRVFEVKRGGALVGLWYFDPFARTGKRSGAWMNSYRSQEKFKRDVKTIVSNNCNFVKGAPGEAVLISWDDAVTLFHEFGHAIHGLLSDVNYPTLAGTNVARDYVEFPSQLNEHWLPTPQVLNKFALHHKTGQPIPQALVDRIKKAETFNQGFDTVEYLASALIDMKLHLAGDADIDPDRFEREELAKLGMPKEIVMRHRTPQFGHIFSSDGYSAGYYSYLWADTLTADCAEAFEAAPGGYYDKGVAARLYKDILSKGNTADPADQFRAFRGRDPDPAALMRKRGFAPART
jgi:peptidyl-dipeptidase Dcp